MNIEQKQNKHTLQFQYKKYGSFINKIVDSIKAIVKHIKYRIKKKYR